MFPIAPFTATGCPMGPPPGLLRTWMGHVRENRAAARAARAELPVAARTPGAVHATPERTPERAPERTPERTPAHAGHR